MDIVFIRELRVDALIGVYDWERSLRQTLVFDLEMGADIRPAASSDDIALALDYHAVSLRLAAIVQSSSFQLVESLAETVASTLMREFAIPWLRLRIAKPGAVPGALEVGVVIERGG
jgi:7,8-dihydroneopterin aldolase/epimerase/oxygenase